jgi:hypothetical protein
MQVLLTATVLNVKKLLTAVARRTKGIVSAVGSSNFLCMAFTIDVLYRLNACYQQQECVKIECSSGITNPLGHSIVEIK